MALKNKIILISVFAIAIAYLEAAVVVYMREILYPGGFEFPLSPVPADLIITELFRELATLVIIVSIGRLAARSFSTGFAWFLYIFAIWDIFYYVFLWLLLGWPESLMTWDVLFLIPTTWTGPVITPVLVALSMILLSMIILRKAESGKESRIPGKIWAGLILGSLILIFGWVFDYSRHMLSSFSLIEMTQVKNPLVMEWATSYVPLRFPWGIFALGEGLILASIAWYWRSVR